MHLYLTCPATTDTALHILNALEYNTMLHIYIVFTNCYDIIMRMLKDIKISTLNDERLFSILFYFKGEQTYTILWQLHLSFKYPATTDTSLVITII
ncbi:hypothetical protein CKR_2231 [Clostridium kluyveri NBRC 12016]|uniref:Uncharacterized protein n=1 Tax=Clostridium kluyveri (strain NBRC 12016) TaxID=583346 RepID=B9E457_CLOK1|nr:hypothetical protein CKR_2231 [Clostridium kluyveri NBRC 12016]